MRLPPPAPPAPAPPPVPAEESNLDLQLPQAAQNLEVSVLDAESPPPCGPVLHLQPQQPPRATTPTAGVTEEEEEEEEDMQGWVCLPVDKAFSLDEGIIDLGEDRFSDGCTSSAGGFPQKEVLKELREKDLGDEMMNEKGGEAAVEAASGLRRGTAAEFNAGGSGFKGDSSMKPQDADPNKETSEEEMKSSVSLQVSAFITIISIIDLAVAVSTC